MLPRNSLSLGYSKQYKRVIEVVKYLQTLLD